MPSVSLSTGQSIVRLATAIVLGSFVVQAYAHAELESCEPPIDGKLSSAPLRIVCNATESMDVKGSSLQVFDSSGTQVDKGDSRVELNGRNRRTIVVSLDLSRVKGGVYIVRWKTLSAEDGDVANGEFHLTVAR
jgi:copper transport protein